MTNNYLTPDAIDIASIAANFDPRLTPTIGINDEGIRAAFDRYYEGDDRLIAVCDYASTIRILRDLARLWEIYRD